MVCRHQWWVLFQRILEIAPALMLTRIVIKKEVGYPRKKKKKKLWFWFWP